MLAACVPPLHVVRKLVVGPWVLVPVQKDVARLAAAEATRILLNGARWVVHGCKVSIWLGQAVLAKGLSNTQKQSGNPGEC